MKWFSISYNVYFLLGKYFFKVMDYSDESSFSGELTCRASMFCCSLTKIAKSSRGIVEAQATYPA